MDFATQQRNPRKHLIGIVGVTALHVAIFWALASGLGQKALNFVKKPIETKLIEEIKPPPPPPPPPPPQQVVKTPPKSSAPPPPSVPIPDTPPPNTPAPQITVQQTDTPPPPAPIAAPVKADPGPPTPAAPPVAKPSVISGVSCPNQPQKPDYPRNALKDEIQGVIVVRATVSADGNVSNPRIMRAEGMSSNDARKYFGSVLLGNAVQYKCGAREGSVEVDITYAFKLE